MPRNSDDARKRLRHAALELFAQNGFDQTTAAQIAALAGVTERTFFRHFPDKREVLFDGTQILGIALREAIATLPPGLGPMQIMRRAFAAVTLLLEQNRPYSEPRQRIIAAHPALQERETAKHVALVRDVATALQDYGIARPRAELASHTSMAILSYALTAWFADPAANLAACIDAGFAEFDNLNR